MIGNNLRRIKNANVAQCYKIPRFLKVVKVPHPGQIPGINDKHIVPVDVTAFKYELL